jgi:MraZ protein
MVFRGTYEYAIDARGRVPLPARYRDAFAEGVVLVQSPDGCIDVYTPSGYDAWASFLTKVKPNRQRGRRLRRGFFGRSIDAELDRQGRILVPSFLRQHADLSAAVLMIGRGECLEIWNPKHWEAEAALVDEEYDAALESMEERP